MGHRTLTSVRQDAWASTSNGVVRHNNVTIDVMVTVTSKAIDK